MQERKGFEARCGGVDGHPVSDVCGLAEPTLLPAGAFGDPVQPGSEAGQHDLQTMYPHADAASEDCQLVKPPGRQPVGLLRAKDPRKSAGGCKAAARAAILPGLAEDADLLEQGPPEQAAQSVAGVLGGAAEGQRPEIELDPENT